MRALLAVAFVIVTSVAAFTYRDLILGRHQTVRRPTVERAVMVVRARPTPANPAALAATIDSLAAMDAVIDGFMAALQEAPDDPRAMTDLAFFYMKHGWFDRAVGPLALAREVGGENEAISRYLELAIARSGQGHIDLFKAAREFEAMAADWGHGC